jgi:hypothetical protein
MESDPGKIPELVAIWVAAVSWVYSAVRVSRRPCALAASTATRASGDRAVWFRWSGHARGFWRSRIGSSRRLETSPYIRSVTCPACVRPAAPLLGLPYHPPQ